MKFRFIFFISLIFSISFYSNAQGQNDTIIYDLYAINGDDPNALGELTDFYVSIDNRIEQSKIDFSVYPCPAKDYVIIEKNFSDEFEIFIYDISGKIKLVSKMNEKIKKVNINNFRSGVYVLKAVGKDGIFNFKIIKN